MKSFNFDLVGLRLARGADQIDDVILHLVIDVNVVDHLAGVQNLLRLNDRAGDGRAGGARHQIEDLPLFRARRIADLELEHETIDLRFGQRIRAFLFDGILRGQHQERFFQLEGLFADGDLLFLHRFEQRALHFGGRAVDFVGEHEIGEDGPLPGGESRPIADCKFACR